MCHTHKPLNWHLPDKFGVDERHTTLDYRVENNGQFVFEAVKWVCSRIRLNRKKRQQQRQTNDNSMYYRTNKWRCVQVVNLSCCAIEISIRTNNRSNSWLMLGNYTYRMVPFGFMCCLEFKLIAWNSLLNTKMRRFFRYGHWPHYKIEQMELDAHIHTIHLKT